MVHAHCHCYFLFLFPTNTSSFHELNSILPTVSMNGFALLQLVGKGRRHATFPFLKINIMTSKPPSKAPQNCSNAYKAGNPTRPQKEHFVIVPYNKPLPVYFRIKTDNRMGIISNLKFIPRKYSLRSISTNLHLK